jgi:integrase
MSQAPLLDDTLSSCFETLYRRHKLAGKSDGTIRKHRAAIRHMSRVLGRPARLSDLSDLAILDVMDDLVRKGRATPTCNNVRSKLVAQWAFYARKGLVSVWPDVLEFDEPEKIPVAWLPGELARLFAACAMQRGAIYGRPASTFWLGLHSVLYDTGERIGAVMQLTWGDVDLDGRWVSFRAVTRKGKKKPMMKQLHSDTVKLLAPFAGKSPDRVFPWELTMERLWQKYEDVLRDAGLPTDRWHKFHQMRRTHASFFEAAGGDATRSLGHSSRAITETSYLDPRIVREKQACDVLQRPIAEKLRPDGPDDPTRAA